MSKHTKYSNRLAGLIAALLMTSACGLDRPDDIVEGGESDPSIRIRIESGDGQSGIAGATLATPLVVTVERDQSPIENFTIDFAITSGGGRLSELSVRTDVLGHARTTLTLGTAKGPNTIEARGAGTDSVAVFTTSGTSGPVVRMVATHDPTGTVASATPLVITAEDANANGVAGVPVGFVVLSGGGSLSELSVTTGDDGRAQTMLTLGTLAGMNRVEAHAPGAGAPVNLDVVGVGGSPTQLAIVSGNNQTGLAGAALASPLVVSVKDVYGNLVSGAAVSFVVTSGGGTMSQTTASNANGVAQSTLTLAPSFASSTVEARLAGATTPVFSASARSYAPKVDYVMSSSYAKSITSGDLNGDAKPDLVICNSSYGISIQMNTTLAGAATPTYAPRQDMWTYQCGQTAIGDVTGDGKPDLVVAQVGYNVQLFPNATETGATTATFTAAVNLYTYYVNSVALADMNADGLLDIVMGSSSYGNVNVYVNATTDPADPIFETGSALSIDGTNAPAVTVGDMNSDGKVDIVVASSTYNKVSVFLSTTAATATTATFAAKVDFTVGTTPSAMVARDFNGDGKLDLAVTNSASNTVSVLLNTTANLATTPSFASKVDFATGTAPASLAVGDMNKDGKLDLVLTNLSANTASVLLNTGTSSSPSFAAKLDLATGTGPRSVALADINADSHLDLAITNETSNTVSVLLSR